MCIANPQRGVRSSTARARSGEYRDTSLAVVVALLAADDALAMGDNELGLPAWLNNLLQPGVGKGAFLTLKLSLIGTVLTALSMLYVVTDEQIRFHLYVFTSLAVVLTGLVFWFIAEAGDAIFQPEAPKKKD